MDRFRKILVSVNTDDSETSPTRLDRAIRLAQDTGAALHVVEVVREASPLEEFIFGHSDTDDLIATEKEKQLKKFCDPIAKAGVKFESAVLRGRPFFEIISAIQREGCDLLLRDSTGTHLSSIDMRLLRNCPCPVWIQNGKFIPFFQRVLVAIDPLPENDAAKLLNRQILDLASSLATWEDAELHVVAAWQIRGEPLLISKMNETAFLEHGTAIKRAADDYLKGLLRDLPHPVPKDRVNFAKGDGAHEIRRTAAQIDADVIVMGTQARTGIPGFLMGNTAESILRQTQRSVLAMKPSGFTVPDLVDA